MTKKTSKKPVEKGPTKEELTDHLQRLQAEFDNYRKRTEDEMQSCRDRAGNRLIEDFLTILDNLTLAIEHAEKDPTSGELLKGVLLIKEQFLQTLQGQGVEPIPTEGTFDPELHEALMTTESEKPQGTILQTLQKGYTRNGKILRTAKVSVAK